MYTLTQTINWAQPFIQYSPLTAGVLQEPAISVATMVRNSILGAHITWPWNRAESSGTAITAGTQDYTISIADFGFLEKATLLDDQGNTYELKYVLNSDPLAQATTVQARPNSISVLTVTPYTSLKVRLMGVPQASYTLVLTYQKIAPPFVGGDAITSVTFSGTTATYAGAFTLGAYPASSLVTITGFVSHTGNNGTFTVTSATTSQIVVTNAQASTGNETHAAVATNPAWYYIPDNYMDIYNNLFLSEAYSLVDDVQQSQRYRQRGVAAFLARAEGLSEAQKNAFMMQWNIDMTQGIGLGVRAQQGIQARGI